MSGKSLAVTGLIALLLLWGGILLIQPLRQSEHPVAERENATGTRINPMIDGSVRSPAADVTALRRSPQMRKDPEPVSHRRGVRSGDTLTSSAPAPAAANAYLDALLAQMEKDGRDNAMIHYILATELAPDLPPGSMADFITLVMAEGWDSRADELLPYLMEWQAALEELQKGAALDYSNALGNAANESPGFNSVKLQYLSKMAAVYARYLESQGQYEEAAHQIRNLMTMGRDLGNADQMPVSHMLGTAIKAIGVKQISQMAASDHLTGYERQVIQELARFDGGELQTLKSIQAERDFQAASMKKLADPARFDEVTADNDAKLSLEQMQHLEQLNASMLADAEEYFSKPYYERGEADVDRLDPLVKSLFQNFLGLDVRYHVSTSLLRQAQIDLAIREFHSNHNRLPGDLGELSGTYLPTVPNDPFTGNSFTYKPSGNSFDPVWKQSRDQKTCRPEHQLPDSRSLHRQRRSAAAVVPGAHEELF